MSLSPRLPAVAIWPSMFAVSMGLMAVIPTLGLYLQDRFGLQGAELTFWTGWVYGAAPLAAAVAGPFWGVLGDRSGRRRMVIRAVGAIALTTGAMAFAPGPGWLLALRIVQGMFAGFIAPAMALGTEGVPPGQQGRVLGRLQLALALGLLLGPAVGAEIAHRFGRTAVFTFTSLVSGLALLPVLFFVAKDRPVTAAGGTRPGLLLSLRKDLGGLLGNRVFLMLLACVFLMRFGQQMVEPFVSLRLRELGPLPLVEAWVGDPVLAAERTVALAFIVLAVGQLLLATRWGALADRIGPLRCLTILAVGLATVFLLTAASERIESFMLLRAAAAVFMAGSMTLAYTAAARRVAPERKSLAFTLVQSGMQFGLALGPASAGWLATRPDVPRFYFVGGCCLSLAALGMMILRNLDGRRGVPVAGGAGDGV